MSIVLHSDLVIKDGVLADTLVLEGNWRYSQEAMKEYAEKKELYITRDLYLRRIVSNVRYKTMKDLLPRIGDDTDVSHKDDVDVNNLSNSGWGSNEDADEELRLLFGVQKMMDYPKPSRLIIKLLASYRNTKDSVIMDFFSGSATTAHATMWLNSKDGGKRQFIMVQLPEEAEEGSATYKAGYKTICEVGEERIRRAGKKIKEETGANIDYGFRVFKVDTTNMNEVYYRPKDYKQGQMSFLANNIKEDRTPEDLLFQVMLDLGVLLSSKIEETTIAGKKVFSVADGYLIACFDNDITDETVKAIAQKHPFYAVFRDSGMANDSVMTNFEQIFETYSPKTQRKVL